MQPDETWWDQATRYEQHWRQQHINRINERIRAEEQTYGNLTLEVLRGLRMAIDAINQLP